jgi:AAA+ ATPase superfamily predicted ATPase
MFQQKFINREMELTNLEQHYKKLPAFIVVYGRRRVGKTALLAKFSDKKKAVYHLCDASGDINNINMMKRAFADFLEDEYFGKIEFSGFYDLFKAFAEKIPPKTIIIIDEFPYLIEKNDAIPSIFQKVWDEVLSKKKAMLILAGSSVRIMENEVLAYNSPLYGRRTGQIEVKAMEYHTIPKFWKVDKVTAIEIFSVTDGIPAYIWKLDQEGGFEKSLMQNLFNPSAFLYEEVEFLLKQEIREKSNYYFIMHAISQGRSRFGDIVSFTGLDKTLVSKYLDSMLTLRILKKSYPATQKRESRNAHYSFADNFFRFWFSFVYPNKALVELGQPKKVMDKIKNEFHTKHVPHVFEKVCRRFLYLSGKYQKVGSWWDKNVEIDIAAVSEKTTLFAECKWSKDVKAPQVISNLHEKVVASGFKGNCSYAVFAKSYKEKISGFKGIPVECYTLDDLF